MNEVINQDRNTTDTQQEHHDDAVVIRKRGRPKGSKNRTYRRPREEGWGNGGRMFGRAKSVAAHRKWQREWVLPQFVMSRKQAQDLLVKFLRSKAGKPALSSLVSEGFAGLSKMPDNKLGEFLVSTNLLSRYPHEVVVRGA